MQITFRTGPGTDRKILSLLSSDQQVTFLQSEGEWAKVGLPNGKEGWVLQRYISTEVPCRIRINDMSQTLAALKTELEAMQKTNGQLETDKSKLAMARQDG
jgi:SH3 domain protein